jgi:hypothetical protein
MDYRSNITYENQNDKNNREPDIVYFNADIINNTNKDVGGGDTNTIKFIETRANNIINNISLYEMSIVRFSLNGSGKDLPLLIPTIKLNQSDVNLTTYRIRINISKKYLSTSGATITYADSKFSDVIYIPENKFYTTTSNLPNPPINSQDVRSDYYWIYNYNHFSTLINNTINTIFSDLSAGYAANRTANSADAASNPTIVAKAPKLVYDQNSNLFSIYYDTHGFGETTETNNTIGYATEEILSISFNRELFNLLSNFDFENVGVVSSPLPIETYKLLVINKNFTNFIAPNADIPAHIKDFQSTKGYWKMTQNYESTSSLWCPISSIVFTSSLIPIQSEQMGNPSVFGDSNDSLVNSTSSNFAPIITDISIPLDNAHGYRGFIQYAPNSEYRMTSFTKSNQPLKNIDIQVFWKNRIDNTLTAVKLPNYGTCHLKIMFRKKRKD